MGSGGPPCTFGDIYLFTILDPSGGPRSSPLSPTGVDPFSGSTDLDSTELALEVKRAANLKTKTGKKRKGTRMLHLWNMYLHLA